MYIFFSYETRESSSKTRNLGRDRDQYSDVSVFNALMTAYVDAASIATQTVEHTVVLTGEEKKDVKDEEQEERELKRFQAGKVFLDPPSTASASNSALEGEQSPLLPSSAPSQHPYTPHLRQVEEVFRRMQVGL